MTQRAAAWWLPLATGLAGFELRTPLNAISGFAQLMHDAKVGPVSPEHREYLGDILTSSRHLLELINDVLDLAKVEAGRMEFRPEAVRLASVVGEVRDTLRGPAASRRMTVEVEVDERLGEVIADPAKLKQVLYNYLSNALKFTPEGGRVGAESVRNQGSLFFAVLPRVLRPIPAAEAEERPRGARTA